MKLFDKVLPRMHASMKEMIEVLNEKELKEILDARKVKKGTAAKALVKTPAKQAKVTPKKSPGGKKSVAK